jgi:transcriptional repressor NrdR
MYCPFCGHEDSQVMETRVSEAGDSIRRRRRCLRCDQRFTTYERVERQMPAVIKSRGVRVDYDRAKVLASMQLALRKRPVGAEQIVEAVDSIEGRLFKMGAREVDSARIGELVMDELKRLDEVAYIRFASVYRQFEDIEAFAEAIKEMKPRARMKRVPPPAGRTRS